MTNANMQAQIGLELCTEWINMVTVNQAKHLLRQPNMLVKQVADELGFPEQFTFRKYFKTNTGISPTEYQNHK